MTDAPNLPSAPAFWPVVAPYATSMVRHFGTLAAGALLAHGLIATSQQTEFVEVTTAIVAGGLSQAWAWASTGTHAKLAAQVDHLVSILFGPASSDAKLDALVAATGTHSKVLSQLVESVSGLVADAAPGAIALGADALSVSTPLPAGTTAPASVPTDGVVAPLDLAGFATPSTFVAPAITKGPLD